MKPTFAIAEVKSAASDSPNGEFEIIMSTDSIDRDGEIIVKGAFSPLPDSIPVHAFHDFTRPVGRVVPAYDAEGRLVGRGFFGSDEESQRMRQKVADGIIGHTSVGFMTAERDRKDGVPHVTKAELLEVSFVSVPSQRDAAVLMAKQYDADDPDTKATKADRLQSIHDMAVANGALCSGKAAHSTDTTAPEAPAPVAGKSPVSVVTQARTAVARALLDV
jgi:HK97 family phage prohead protease